MRLIITYWNIGFFQRGIFLICVLLLFLGEKFSKFPLIDGYLYLHDTIVILFFMLSLMTFRLRYVYKRYLFVFLIAIVYFIDSFISDRPLAYVIRGFAIFFYLAVTYQLFQFFKNKNIYNITFFKRFSYVSCILQLIYLCFIFFFKTEFSLFSYNYFSSIQVIGLIIFVSFSLVYIHGIFKWILIFFSIFLLMTSGHSSAFMSGVMCLLCYLLFRFNKKFVFIGLFILIPVIVLFMWFYIPEFHDSNVIWRLLYWTEIIRNVVWDKFCLLGNGFGVPYMSDTILTILSSELNKDYFDGVGDDIYKTAPHNSFLSIMFHIGVVPTLILFSPLQKVLKYIFYRSKYYSKDKDFLVFSLIGIFVWCAFNVILELPHSAILIWLVYFTTIWELRKI